MDGFDTRFEREVDVPESAEVMAETPSNPTACTCFLRGAFQRRPSLDAVRPTAIFERRATHASIFAVAAGSPTPEK